MFIRAICAALVLGGGAGRTAIAQSALDSIPVWTHVLQTGTLSAREGALANLARLPAPASARDAAGLDR